MITLSNVTIHRYKSIETDQSFTVEPDVTVLVGMNESGKTSVLEALAKSKYFTKDSDFEYSLTHDYPRKQKKAVDKSGETPSAITLEYTLSAELLKQIENDLSIKLKKNVFSIETRYDGTSTVYTSLFPSTSDFLKRKLALLDLPYSEYSEHLLNVKNQEDFDEVLKEYFPDDTEKLNQIRKYFLGKDNWPSPLSYYTYATHILCHIPKFMYYDDYYMLPSRISIDTLNKKETLNSSEKTARALLELSDIDTDILVKSDDFEEFKAELEATQAIISEELFKYWSTNKNLNILFDIDKKEKTDPQNNKRIVDHILDIRVQNTRSKVSLPLKNRSKGFNWFFSFLVWFKKIQEDKNNSYILLLDEPGLNLHAMAQNDLLKFIEDLSKEYQVIYTTHSPFMIDSSKLHQVRTIVEKDDGSHISESVQEKDPNTLFPLQAALGYTLAQNLFVSPRNLVVEGIADLTYLSLMSDILEGMGRKGLKRSITIVPVGGADKVATFVSLLRGNELNLVCLLDTFTDQAAKARLDKLIVEKLIKDNNIVFYHEFTGLSYSDVEDLFQVDEYLTIYNGAFGKNIVAHELDASKSIVAQLRYLNNKKDFNHYLPANYLMRNIADVSISDDTLCRFEDLFAKINKII